MAKRFPVLYPMPFGEEQYRQYLTIAKEQIEFEKYLDRAWKEILPDNPRVCNHHKESGLANPILTCPDCIRYDKSMIKRTTSNLISCGFLMRKKTENKKTAILIHDHCLDFVEDGPIFDCVRSSLLFAWDAYKNLNANQIAVESIIDIIDKLDDTKYISQKDLRTRLSIKKNSINGYIWNVNSERSLRELLKLLELMGGATSENGKYKLNGKKTIKIRRSFKKISVLYDAEDIIKTLGASHYDLDRKFLISLSKYYIYRHSGGIGKHRSIISDLIKRMDVAHIKIFEKYQEQANKKNIAVRKGKNFKRLVYRYKKFLANNISEKFDINHEDSLYKNHITRMTISTLERAIEVHSIEELKTLIRRSKGRFDRTILDELKHEGNSFTFPDDFQFYSDLKWQLQAVNAWMKDDLARSHKAFSGIVSAVTGSGKTIMALLAIQEYIKINKNAIITIIVPTKVLMYQWAKELSKMLALSSNQIGLRGDGFKDSFDNGKRVIVAIVNSAIRNEYLKNDIETIGDNIKHLLIADECHRYGGVEFNHVFDCRIDASLGLSATPPSDLNPNSVTESIDNAVLQDLGPQFYHLNYNKAREENLICEFKIKFVGIILAPSERIQYDAFSKAIRKALEKIKLRYGHRLDSMKASSFDQKLQYILNNDEHPDSAIAKYFRLTKERRNVIYDSLQRMACYYHILKKGLDEDKTIMIFHEKISQLEMLMSIDKRHETWKGLPKEEKEIYQKLQDLSDKVLFRPVVYHSKQDPKWNSWAMEWFKKKHANVMISVKALVEGVDVPSADLGIVRISSSSVRQRIQTTGRILRKDRDKKAEIYVLFVLESVDENIFKAYDWKRELGVSTIEYYHWNPEKEENNENPFVQQDILSLPIPQDYEDNRPPLEVDVTDLVPGDTYPGRFAGDLYHVTANGKPYKRSRFGRIFLKSKEMIEAGQLIREIKGGGKLIVSPQGNIITRIKGKGTIFLGTVEPDKIREEITQKMDSLNKSKRKNGKSRKVPTFEELFGSQ